MQRPSFTLIVLGLRTNPESITLHHSLLSVFTQTQQEAESLTS